MDRDQWRAALSPLARAIVDRIEDEYEIEFRPWAVLSKHNPQEVVAWLPADDDGDLRVAYTLPKGAEVPEGVLVGVAGNVARTIAYAALRALAAREEPFGQPWWFGSVNESIDGYMQHLRKDVIG